MSSKSIPIAKPYIDQADIHGVINVLRSGYLSIGKCYKQFEFDFANYIGSKYACAISSGTAGLHLAVKALGIIQGDEVITTPFSFVASSNCLLYESVKPVFVDINEKTFNIDPAKIEGAITSHTKAILVVHIFGHPADMGPIVKIAKKHKLKIIEDACESIGATYHNRFAGTFGDIGIFAFYPNKQITTGEGGMIVTNSKNLYKLCCSLRNQGRDSENEQLTHDRLGYNYRLDEMSASLGITQLKKIDWLIQQRVEIAKLYTKYLKSNSCVVLPSLLPHQTHSWFVYVIRITNGKRDRIRQILQQNDIQTKIYLPVIHLQPFMIRKFGYKKGDFPIAEMVSLQALALPFFVGLKERDIKKIAYIISQNL